jgi:3-oxoacyl-[acyl-carrier-protein] synthase-3
MGFLKVDNIRLCGISACVPKNSVENHDFVQFDEAAYNSFVTTTGIERRRTATAETCTSDLCIAAAERLVADLQWRKDEIKLLVFVSQTPDYILPATSPLIQNRLGLSADCYTLDVSLGCSGWVYGLNVISSIIKTFTCECNTVKGLLLAGDTISKLSSETDKSVYPLFGDAGTATAIELVPDVSPMLFNMNTDGAGYKTIIVNDGGFRNPVSEKSFNTVNRGDGIVSNNLNLLLDGMDVFAFGIKRAPENVNRLLEHFGLDKEATDYFIFHQANKFMNEQIRKKLKLDKEKVPYSLRDFGNTSSATIPMTMVTELADKLQHQKLHHVACGFGVGLSWGSVWFETD